MIQDHLAPWSLLTPPTGYARYVRGREFAFGAEEQRFFREKGFEPPRRCEECRRAKHDGHASMEKKGGKK